MIEINLLPEELKKKKGFRMPEITIAALPVIIVMAVSLVLVQISLIVIINVNQAACEKMTREWEETRPQKKSVEISRRENTETQKKVEAISKDWQGGFLLTQEMLKMKQVYIYRIVIVIL